MCTEKKGVDVTARGGPREQRFRMHDISMICWERDATGCSITLDFINEFLGG